MMDGPGPPHSRPGDEMMGSNTADRSDASGPGPPGARPTPGDCEGDDPWQTSGSLLVRLRDRADQRAWAEFVGRYSPLIRYWCRAWFPREADDLVQEVLARFVTSAGSIDYDPRRGRFRGWLKTVTHHLMADLKRRHPMRGQGGSSEHPDVAAQEARLDLEQRLAAEYDLELLDRARQRVRPRVDPRTWAV